MVFAFILRLLVKFLEFFVFHVMFFKGKRQSRSPLFGSYVYLGRTTNWFQFDMVKQQFFRRFYTRSSQRLWLCICCVESFLYVFCFSFLMCCSLLFVKGDVDLVIQEVMGETLSSILQQSNRRKAHQVVLRPVVEDTPGLYRYWLLTSFSFFFFVPKEFFYIQIYME